MNLRNSIGIKCTINSKINGIPEGVYLPISKLHSILAAANLLGHNNLWLWYYMDKTFEGTIYFTVDGTMAYLTYGSVCNILNFG